MTVQGADADPQRGPGPAHEHVVPPALLWPWLPKAGHGDLAKHPYCKVCGQVAVVGADRALKVGTLVNVLAALAKRVRKDGRRLTEAQRRLVLQHLQREGADDPFGLTREAQFRVLEEALARYAGFEKAYLEGVLGDLAGVRV